MDGAILIASDGKAGTVHVHNCKEIWGELKGLGFEYDLVKTCWVMPISEAAALIGQHELHEGVCDQACAPREAILSLIEREFFAVSRPSRTPSPPAYPPAVFTEEGGGWTARGGGGVEHQSRLRKLG